MNERCCGDPEKDRAIYENGFADQIHQQREGSAAGVAGDERHSRAQRRSRAGGRNSEERRPNRRRALLSGRRSRLLQAREPDRCSASRTVAWFDKYLKGDVAAPRLQGANDSPLSPEQRSFRSHRSRHQRRKRAAHFSRRRTESGADIARRRSATPEAFTPIPRWYGSFIPSAASVTRP